MSSIPLSRFRAIAQTAFFSNNIKKINLIKEAYNLSIKNPSVIISDQKIFKAKELGFPEDSKVIVSNDGAVVARSASARKVLEEPGIDPEYYAKILSEAVYDLGQKKSILHSQSMIGLDSDFMVKANLLIPEKYEYIILSWLSNFQEINAFYKNKYQKSKKYNENEILVVSDPDWKHDNFPNGLCFFAPKENTAFILGMRYFGEYKKSSLTLAWNIAVRNGFTACHGGLKTYTDNEYTAAFFGLSGSGKSTLTHSTHNNKYKVSILHDDAFIINDDSLNSFALEPSYFDKTSDYKIGSEDNKFILTAQNIAIGTDSKGKKVLVTEDIRNKNGRAVKSRLWSKNRVDKVSSGINAVFWLMRDSCIPPLLKINNAHLAASFGATLTTHRTSAEENSDTKSLIIEPYANPFRTYALSTDYKKFHSLFMKGVDCYILNTSDFWKQEIKPEISLKLIEDIINNNIKLKKLFNLTSIEYTLPEQFYEPDHHVWRHRIIENMFFRLSFLNNQNSRNKLPPESVKSIKEIIWGLEKFQDK